MNSRLRRLRCGRIASLAVLFTGYAVSQPEKIAAFSDWPAGKSPAEIGHQVATNMLPRWIVTEPGGHSAGASVWVHGLQFAARKGWLALTRCVGAGGNVGQVCVGAGQKNDRQFYLHRPRAKGDHHGQAPTLGGKVALLRPD